MFAVIKTGGKQYRVAPGDIIAVEKLAGEPDTACSFDEVLMIGDDGKAMLDAASLRNARVEGTIVARKRAEKITIYKSRQRNTYRRKLGHRQHLSVVRITAIETRPRTAAKKASGAAARPKTAKPRATTAPAAEPGTDDLTRIKGIGPALASKLAGTGLTRFAQLAQLDDERIAALEQELKIQGRFKAGDWVAQAKALK